MSRIPGENIDGSCSSSGSLSPDGSDGGFSPSFLGYDGGGSDWIVVAV